MTTEFLGSAEELEPAYERDDDDDKEGGDGPPPRLFFTYRVRVSNCGWVGDGLMAGWRCSRCFFVGFKFSSQGAALCTLCAQCIITLLGTPSAAPTTRPVMIYAKIERLLPTVAAAALPAWRPQTGETRTHTTQKLEGMSMAYCCIATTTLPPVPLHLFN